jgi:mannan endo-1,6-alpha-mannosidase
MNATGLFFSNQGAPNIMVEVACENTNTCNTDQLSFKAYLARWMAASSVLAPFTRDYVKQKLSGSAAAAALQCSGGASKTLCGQKWFQGATWDGTTGVGQQMSALEAIQTNMMFLPEFDEDTGHGGSGNSSQPLKGPVTANTGGTSVGDPNAGTQPSMWDGMPILTPINNGDKAGAAILTILAISLICGGSVWINLGE